MDVVSHSLWGVALFRGRVKWWAAAASGALPDVVAFLPTRTYELIRGDLNIFHEVRPVSDYPTITMPLYHFSHSLAGLAALALCTWLVLRAWPALARKLEAPTARPTSPGTLTACLLGPSAFHLAVDVPLHAADFFPTPILWPFSDWVVAGIPWAQAGVWIPNLVLLALALAYTWPRATISPRPDMLGSHQGEGGLQ